MRGVPARLNSSLMRIGTPSSPDGYAADEAYRDVDGSEGVATGQMMQRECGDCSDVRSGRRRFVTSVGVELPAAKLEVYAAAELNTLEPAGSRDGGGAGKVVGITVGSNRGRYRSSTPRVSSVRR